MFSFADRVGCRLTLKSAEGHVAHISVPEEDILRIMVLPGGNYGFPALGPLRRVSRTSLTRGVIASTIRHLPCLISSLFKGRTKCASPPQSCA